LGEPIVEDARNLGIDVDGIRFLLKAIEVRVEGPPDARGEPYKSVEAGRRSFTTDPDDGFLKEA